MTEYIESMQDLESSTSSIRLGIIRNLRLKIQQGIPLPSDANELSYLISKLKSRLTDSSPEVIVQILLFLNDMIVTSTQTDTAEQTLEPALLSLLPQLVILLGFSSSTVRKTALETHKCYLRHVKNNGPLITCLIKYGIENEEWRTRKEALSAFNILITPEIGDFDSSHIVAALISRLRDVSETVVQHAVNSLIHLRMLIGDEPLLGYVRKLSNISRQLFRQYHARIITGPTQKSSMPTGKNIPIPITDINFSITNSFTEKTIEKPKVSDSQNLSSSQNILFGYVPEELIDHIKNNSDYKIRSQSIEKLHQITQEITDPSVLKNDMKGLLEYLFSFLNDSNFKITLTSIYIIGQIIDISGLEIVHQMACICSHLIAKFSDNKAIIRQAAIKVIVKLMRNLEAPSILEMCLAYLGDNNPRIREEVINLTSTALLTFPNANYDFKMLLRILAPSLLDSKPKVKFVTMESVAIIAHFISPEQTMLLLQEAGLSDESRELLNLRFNDPILPHLNSEGIIIHTISRSNNETPAPSPLNRESSKILAPKISSKSNIFAKSFLEPARPLSELGTISTDGKNISEIIIEAKLSKLGISNQSLQVLESPASEEKRSRSFSASEAAQKKPSSEESSKNFSIYAPDFKLSKIQSETENSYSNIPIRRVSQIPEPLQESDGILEKVTVHKKNVLSNDQNSPFGSSTKLRRTPPNTSPVPENNSEDKAIIHGKKLARLDDTETPTSEESTRMKKVTVHKKNVMSNDQNSPFGSSAKLRRTPPNTSPVPENNAEDKAIIHGEKLARLDDTETPSSEESIRILKTFSAPSDRMRSLEDDDSAYKNSMEQSPERAKTSVSKNASKLSQATRKRIEAKNTVNSSQAAALREREKEQRLQNQIVHDYKEAVQLINANAEWNELSGALLAVQKAIKYRPDLIQKNLHDLTLSLITQVHNLRSSVAKIAISCFNDMFIKFKKLMDNDLDLTANAILKKIGESGFLVDEAIKCLSSMIENVTNTRAIMVLINNSDHKNPAIRLRVSILLETAITSFDDILGSKYVASLRDMEKLLPVLVRFLREGLSDSRNAAKRSLYFLSKLGDFEKVVLKTLSSSQIRELKEAIAFIRDKEERPDELPTRDDYNLEAALEPVSKRKTRLSPVKMHKDNRQEDYDSIYAEISSVDWKRRSQGIDNITKVILHSPQDFKDRHAVQKLFDVFLARCRDGNAKVTVVALESLTKIIPVLGPFFDPILNILIPVITAQMTSTTPNIKRIAGEVMDKLIEFSDALLIIQSLTNMAQFGNNPRLKPLIVEKLCLIVSSYYTTNSAPIIKYIIPISLKLLKESKLELRNINDKLLHCLKGQMGSNLLSYTGSHTNLVRERLSAFDRGLT